MASTSQKATPSSSSSCCGSVEIRNSPTPAIVDKSSENGDRVSDERPANLIPPVESHLSDSPTLNASAPKPKGIYYYG
ncbi:putative cyclic pyranopterin monophosphate synthase [Bienertia sinuspersici]